MSPQWGFDVQQHTHTTVPNLINCTSKIEGKSRQVILHTTDFYHHGQVNKKEWIINY